MPQNNKDEEIVIEPTEVIIEGPAPKEHVEMVNPWVRFLARMTDYALFSIVLLLLAKFFIPSFSFKKYDFLIPYPFFLWIPIEALFLFLWGATPGKFLLKTKVVKQGRGKMDYLCALKRSFLVWLRGFGLGIPIIYLITMLHAYGQLKARKITSWDRDEKTKVTHQKLHPIRLGIAFAVILTSFILDRIFK